MVNNQSTKKELPCVDDEAWILGIARQTCYAYLKKLPPHVDPGDYLSAAYTGALYARATYNPLRGTRFRTWLIHCITMALLQEHRLQHQQRRLEEVLPPHRVDPGDYLIDDCGEPLPVSSADEHYVEVDAEAEALRRMKGFFLREWVEQLPEKQRVVIELRFFHGLTSRETAERLRISRDAVRKRQRVAIAWLKRNVPADTAD